MPRVEIERTLSAASPPGVIWDRCYADARAWPEWNPELASAELLGPFERGTSAKVRFRTGLRLRFHITEVEPGRVFTDEAKLPLARMGHRHALEPAGSGTLLRNTIYFEGPAGRFCARLMGRRAARALEEGQRRIVAMTDQVTATS